VVFYAGLLILDVGASRVIVLDHDPGNDRYADVDIVYLPLCDLRRVRHHSKSFL
jgi:hypothetical protein